MEDLKTKLLKTGYFIENNYLTKYIELCNNGASHRTADYSELHHILQFSYFMIKNNIIDKEERNKFRKLSVKIGTPEYYQITADNQVYLSYYNHCLAHYYLYQCTIGKLKYDNEVAFCKMTDRNLYLRNCSESEIAILLNELEAIRNDPSSIAYKNKCIDNIMLKYYSLGGYKLVQQKLLEHNIEFSEDCIKARARKLHINGAKYKAEWSQEELQIIKDNYPIGGYVLCKKLLPNRTKFAIQARAKYLGLQAPGASKANAGWTEEEDNIIKVYYSIGGAKLCQKYLKNRTLSAIKYRANNKFKIFMEK